MLVEFSDKGQYGALSAGLHGHVICITSLDKSSEGLAGTCRKRLPPYGPLEWL